jgi:adenylate kinase
MKNVILMGPPGAGKGTQAKMISEKLGLIHLSTGDLIREEKEKGSKIGKLAEKLSDHGHYLPDEIVFGMVKQKVIDNPKCNGFIFDGFPRTVDQAKSLDNFLNERKTPITDVVYLEIADETVIERLTERAQIENREDDKPEVLQTRLNTFKLKTNPVINYYNNGYLFASKRTVKKIAATKTRDEVSADIALAINI